MYGYNIEVEVKWHFSINSWNPTNGFYPTFLSWWTSDLELALLLIALYVITQLSNFLNKKYYEWNFTLWMFHFSFQKLYSFVCFFICLCDWVSLCFLCFFVFVFVVCLFVNVWFVFSVFLQAWKKQTKLEPPCWGILLLGGEKLKKYIGVPIAYWKKICPAGVEFCPQGNKHFFQAWFFCLFYVCHLSLQKWTASWNSMLKSSTLKCLSHL